MHRDVWLCHAVGKQEARYGGCCSEQLSVFSNYQKKSPSPPQRTVYTDAINLLLQLFTL